MPYSRTTFVVNDIFTAAQANQLEENIATHLHGASAVSQTLGAAPTASAHYVHRGYLESQYYTVLLDAVDVAVVGTTEAPIASYSIAGNAFGLNGRMSLDVIGDYLQNTGANQTERVRVIYGAVTLFDITQGAVTTSATRGDVRVEVDIQAQAATNVQTAYTKVYMLLPAAEGTGAGMEAGWIRHGARVTSMGVDSTVAQTLAVLVTHGTSNVAMDMRKLSARVYATR